MALNQFPRRSFVGSSTLQTFTGNGTQTAFTLSSAQTQNEVFLFVDDVVQVPGVDFTVSGTTLTFTVAPANNAEIIARGFGVPAPVTTVSDGSVTAAKLASGAIEAKLGYTPVSPTQLSTEVANLVDAAPSTLNTLNELAAALGDDPNYATTITTALGTKANTSSLGTLASISPTGTPDNTKFLRGDNSWQVVAVTPTAVSDQSNISTGYFDLPAGTTAQRPVSPNSGNIRFNSDNSTAEYYDGNGWRSLGAIDGSSQSAAAASAQAIKALGINTSGVYWIKHASGYTTAYQTYCDMTTLGGGWMLAGVWTNAQGIKQYWWNNDDSNGTATGTPNWYTADSSNNLQMIYGTDLANKQNVRMPAFTSHTTSEIMIRENFNGSIRYKAYTLNSNKTLLQRFTQTVVDSYVNEVSSLIGTFGDTMTQGSSAFSSNTLMFNYQLFSNGGDGARLASTPASSEASGGLGTRVDGGRSYDWPGNISRDDSGRVYSNDGTTDDHTIYMFVR